MPTRSAARVLHLTALAVALACTPVTPPPATPKASTSPAPAQSVASAAIEPEPAPPEELFDCPEVPAPLQLSEIVATPKGYAIDGEMEILELELELAGLDPELLALTERPFVVVGGALPSATSVVQLGLRELDQLGWEQKSSTRQLEPDTALVFVRRPRTAHASPISGMLHLPPATTGQGEAPSRGGVSIPFSTTSAVPEPAKGAVLSRWARLLVRELGFRQHNWLAADRGGWLPPHGAPSWMSFAGRRVIERYLTDPKQAKRRHQEVEREPLHRDPLLETMSVFSGSSSLAQALDTMAELPELEGGKGPLVPLTNLTPPALRDHRFRELLGALGRPVPEEPLALYVPAEFWYLRAASLSAAFELADAFDGWASPLAGIWENRSARSGLFERYLTQLGLTRTKLARVLGPSVVRRLAVVGSDPYVNEGTDLTVLFEVTASGPFQAALHFATEERLAEHGGGASEELTLKGMRVRHSFSQDGAVNQWLCVGDQLTLVSNSRGALTRIIETILKKRPNLAEQPDFRYLMARDQELTSDTLVYLSDRFIAETASPRQRILESRRVRRQAELRVPAQAALLFGTLMGRSPKNVPELLASGLLRQSELQHEDGTPISFELGAAPRSAYGTPSSLTPLIELETPKQVTAGEARAYARWAEEYQRTWSDAIDPAALRLSTEDGQVRRITTDLRVMPLLTQGDFRELIEMVGDARLTVTPLESGLRMVVGLGADARFRRELDRALSLDKFAKNLSLDLIGGWAMLGMTETGTALGLLERTEPALRGCSSQRDQPSMAELTEIPAYAAVAINNTPAAVLGLATLRKLLESVLGDELRWEQLKKQGKINVTRIGVGTDQEGPSRSHGLERIDIYFALVRDALYVATHEGTLRALIDQHVAGRGPAVTRQPPPTPSQAFLEFRPKPRVAFEQFLMAAALRATLGDIEMERTDAEGLFRGVPELLENPTLFPRMAEAYLGYVPRPLYGGSFSYGPLGLESRDFGTRMHPKLPRRSELGARYRSFLEGLLGVRAQVAFDVEDPKARPVARSLHTRLEFEFKPAEKPR